jgi:cytochrome c oxidase subunit 1
MGASAIFGMLAGIYHWYPKMFGRLMNKPLGYIHFWLTFISAYLVFFPMHFMGLAGVPRRYFAFSLLPEYGVWLDVNILITVAALIGGAAQLIFIYNFFTSIFIGERAGANPWKANTLEWSTPEERIHGNWDGPIPTVYRGPYEYSHPDREEDYWPQHWPSEEKAKEVVTSPVTGKPKEKETPGVLNFWGLLRSWFKPGIA